MILIEPEELYVRRSASRVSREDDGMSAGTSSANSFGELHGPLRYMDGWDEHILAYVSAQEAPVRIVSLASQLRKGVQHRNKQHKEKLKRDILLRVGALIRFGGLVRVRRKYVLPGTR
jgi:hypothetical protein